MVQERKVLNRRAEDFYADSRQPIADSPNDLRPDRPLTRSSTGEGFDDGIDVGAESAEVGFFRRAGRTERIAVERAANGDIEAARPHRLAHGLDAARRDRRLDEQGGDLPLGDE